jgi:hypothetical protein
VELISYRMFNILLTGRVLLIQCWTFCKRLTPRCQKRTQILFSVYDTPGTSWCPQRKSRCFGHLTQCVRKHKKNISRLLIKP